MFGIFVKRISAEKMAVAQLVIGNWSETIEIPLEFWTIVQYRSQWKAAVARSADGGVSAIVTKMHDPDSANFFEIWAIYPHGEKFYIQNQLLIRSELSVTFDPMKAGQFVRPRQRYNEDGIEISEWALSRSDIESFQVSSNIT